MPPASRRAGRTAGRRSRSRATASEARPQWSCGHAPPDPHQAAAAAYPRADWFDDLLTLSHGERGAQIMRVGRLANKIKNMINVETAATSGELLDRQQGTSRP